MEIKIEVPDYDANCIKYKWTDGFEISVKITDNVVTIAANREGLISLANHLLNLAQNQIPSGHHMHFDAYNSLEDGSDELIIEKS